MWILKSLASFPRPRPAFHGAQYVLPATESWAGAYRRLSIQYESESCLPMITAKKRSPSKVFAVGACLLYLGTILALSYAQSRSLTTSQRVGVASIKILFV